MAVIVTVIRPADMMLVTIMLNTKGTIIIGPLMPLTTITHTRMLIPLTMVGILTPQLEPTLGLTTPIPQLRSPTPLLFIQEEQEEQVVQEEQAVQAEQVAQEEQEEQAELAELAERVARVARVVLAVQEQPAKEAEQVAEVLFWSLVTQ
jgi:hypothetical protein